MFTHSCVLVHISYRNDDLLIVYTYMNVNNYYYSLYLLVIYFEFFLLQVGEKNYYKGKCRVLHF